MMSEPEKKDRMQLLCDIGELNHLFRESISVENFMQRTVEMVSQHLNTDVCSIYIYEDDEDVLILKATIGLNQKAVGRVAMKLGEGLTGQALKELRPICVSDASNHPQYKYFADIEEEQYENFLAVPIVRGVLKIGVLVLQRKEKTRFNDEDVMACRAVASQLANIIENAKFLMTLHLPQPVKTKHSIPESLRFIRGKIASHGFAFSQARVIDKETTFAYLMQKHFAISYTRDEFDQALEKTIKQLELLQKEIEQKLSDAASLIFASHLMILKDHEFIGAMIRLIEEGENPPEAVLKIASEYISIFSTSKNMYVREKVQDVEDLTVRLIGNLIRETEDLGDYNNQVIIARDLFPSDLLRISSEDAAGIILVSGGVTSHLSILARSLQIPMVIANQPELMDIPSGTHVLIDGETGNIYLEPAEDVISAIIEKNRQNAELRAQKPAIKAQTVTKDGTDIHLMVNINLIGDLNLACEIGCEGVGLYRTEFPFVIRSDFPSEEEQYITYSKIIKAMEGKPVVFRTLDIGGDKVLSYYQNAHEQNPSMGMRSIRFSLQNKEVFHKQIRAILRAGADSDLRIMFPMISSLDEYLEAQRIVETCMQGLEQQGSRFHRSPLMGMMIEIPSVINTIESFAEKVDFFSIGTNDLIQFMLGVDRTNENVAQFYIPHHPSVLRGLNHVVQTVREYDKEVSVCGDMAGRDVYLPFLIGIGLRTLSIDPSLLAHVQETISNISIYEAKEVAARILDQSRVSEIEKILGINNQHD